jgi:Na+/melibiose symporter-like transporter
LLYATFNLINQFVAKPLGAWFFVLSAALPFGVNAGTFLLSAALVATIRSVSSPSSRLTADTVPISSTVVTTAAGSDSEPEGASADRGLVGGLSAEIAEGLRFLFGHRLLRTLAVTMAIANLVFCAAFAIFVLYARERLGLSDVGYGVLLTAFAAGGFLGTLVAPRLIRAVGPSLLLRLGLLAEAALHATLALTTIPLVAGLMIVVFGIHTTVWGVVVTTIRQRDIPSVMFGRVTSVYSLVDLTGVATGSIVGGLVASAFGVVATYAMAAVAMVIVVVAAWRPLREATAVPLTS